MITSCDRTTLVPSAKLRHGMPADDLDPTALLERVAVEQSRAAFVELFRYYGPRLEAFLARRGMPAPTTEELVQEIMLTVWRKAKLFDRTRGNASAWIFAVARSTLIDRVRHDRRPEVLDSDPSLRPEAERDAAGPGLEGAYEGRQAIRALDELPPEQAEVLRQSYVEGLTLAEIAERDGLPLGTVKTRARLGLERLRNMLGARRSSS